MKDEKKTRRGVGTLAAGFAFLAVSAGALRLEKLRLEKEPKKSDKRPTDAA